MRHNERPTNATLRSCASPTRAIVSNRATFEAKHATATRLSYLPTNSIKFSRTSPSEPDIPGTNTFVRSQTIARTPSSPTSANFCSSVDRPTKGSGSNFQSPVCMTVPDGVRKTTAFGSGIEWVIVISSTSKGPTENLPGQRNYIDFNAVAKTSLRQFSL